MHLTAASAYVAMVIGICIFAGCKQEVSQKTHATRPALQANPGQQAMMRTGETLFMQYCSPCHPDGGNVSDPQRNLRGSALRKNNIANPEAIVNIMRHPTSRMIRFDETTISDKDALAIAEYVLKNFQ